MAACGIVSAAIAVGVMYVVRPNLVVLPAGTSFSHSFVKINDTKGSKGARELMTVHVPSVWLFKTDRLSLLVRLAMKPHADLEHSKPDKAQYEDDSATVALVAAIRAAHRFLDCPCIPKVISKNFKSEESKVSGVFCEVRVEESCGGCPLRGVCLSRTQRSQGCSGSLAMALSLLERVNDDLKLVRGRKIAASGGLTEQGIVLPVQSIRQKVAGCEADGMGLLLVHPLNFAEARRYAKKLRPIPVRTLGEAVFLLLAPAHRLTPLPSAL